jgi:hypothetical protein
MRIFLAGLLGGVAMFLWGFVSWGVLDWHHVGTLPDEGDFVGALKGTPGGVYFVPGMSHGADLPDDEKAKLEEEWKRKHAQGPRAFVVYRPEGKEAMQPMDFVRGFSLGFLGCLLAAAMLATTRLSSWFGRFVFVVGFGLMAGIGEGYYWNYFSFPDEWTTVMVMDHVAGWATAGFVLASMVKPKPAA